MKRIALLIGATVLLLGTFGSSCSVHCMMQRVMRSCALATQHHDHPAQPIPARAIGTVTMLHGDNAFMIKTTDGKDVTIETSAKTEFTTSDGHAAKKSDVTVERESS